jgi:hypothetical protein
MTAIELKAFIRKHRRTITANLIVTIMKRIALVLFARR